MTVRSSNYILNNYEEHLKTTCGLTSRTIDIFKWHVKKFLAFRISHLKKRDVNTLEPKDFIQYISQLARDYSPHTRKGAATALRSFLRWLVLNNKCSF
jgi:site-specific recombinase XerD